LHARRVELARDGVRARARLEQLVAQRQVLLAQRIDVGPALGLLRFLRLLGLFVLLLGFLVLLVGCRRGAAATGAGRGRRRRAGRCGRRGLVLAAAAPFGGWCRRLTRRRGLAGRRLLLLRRRLALRCAERERRHERDPDET